MDENGNNFNYDDGNSQGQYNQPTGYDMRPTNSDMTLKDWIITLVILSIPCVNIVMLLVWAFSDVNKTRSNYCKASLIVGIAVIVISFLLSLIFGAAIASAVARTMPYYY